MKRIANVHTFLLLLALCIAGCSTLGVPKPENFSEGLAASYSTVTGIRQTALTLLRARTIAPDDAEHVQGEANNGRLGLDVAKRVHASDPAAGQQKLDSVKLSIDAAKAYLCAKAPSDPLCQEIP